jgi:hypothetical protein
MYEGEKMKSFTQIETCQWICVENHGRIRIIRKVIERGHKNPQFDRKMGQNLKLGMKNTKGLNKVPNLILDQNSRSNEFGPQFVLIDVIFYVRKL